MYAQWPVDQAHCQRLHAPTEWDVMKIPSELQQHPEFVQLSGILALPPELLLQIFTHADWGAKLFLALTCKRLLCISGMAVIMIPSAPKHRARRLDCSAMLRVLHVVRPVDARGRPKQSWAPCCVCYRLRPKRKAYWKNVLKRYPKESVCKILVGYDSVVDCWNEKSSSSYQCPECWCNERMDKYGHLVEALPSMRVVWSRR